MSEKYKIRNQEKTYYVTFAVINWIDVFTRREYIEILLSSLQFCQKEKGLEIYAWCIMSSHVHFILGTEGKNKLEDIVRDFKKYSSVQICRAIESNPVESRREWLLWMFKRAAAKTNKHVKYCFWQNEYHPIELSDNNMMDQKLEYIHMNPVVAGLVEEPWHYTYSSAKDYTGMKGLLKIKFIN